MNFSIVTASIPLDEETYNEVKQLCDDAMLLEQCNYSMALQLDVARDFSQKGFFVLAYDNEKDILVGVASAIDQMGINTYEWSFLVAPMYRDIGIDDGLLKVLNDGLLQRGAEGELALIMENDKYGKKVMDKYKYTYSFSEATFESQSKVDELVEPLIMRPFEQKDMESVIGILKEAFGDTRKESIELITYNTMAKGYILWVAELDEEIVGTVTTTKKDDVQWVTALAVHPKMQARGIGTALLKWVQNYASHNGENKVMLDVEIENEYALAVYEKAGFMKSMQVDYFVYGG